MTHTMHNILQRINKPVTIQDILVTGSQPKEAGEFGKSFATVADQKQRLYKHIEELAQKVAAKHRQMNFSSNHMLAGKENAITRLVTNEFAFYTKAPLSIADFNELMQWIGALANKLPQNLHLVLSSFAVRTPDNKIMNVVAQVECGLNSKLSLIVKNKPSAIDPVYSKKFNNKTVALANVDIDKDRVEHYKISFNGKVVPFSFNCVTKCKTSGGAVFHSFIEICLDHSYGLAKNYLDNALKRADTVQPKVLLSSQCSHILTSNSIALYPKYCLGNVTHADPHPSRGKKQGAPIMQMLSINNSFGPPLKGFVTKPTVCSKLPSYEKSLVDAHNAKVFKATQPKPTLSAVKPKPAKFNKVTKATNSKSTPTVALPKSAVARPLPTTATLLPLFNRAANHGLSKLPVNKHDIKILTNMTKKLSVN